MDPILKLFLELLAIYVFLCGTVGLLAAVTLCSDKFVITKNGRLTTESEKRKFFFKVMVVWPWVLIKAKYY